MPSALCKPELRQTMGEANAKMKLSLRKGEEKRQSSLFSGLDPALGSAAARWVAEATPQLWGVPGAPGRRSRGCAAVQRTAPRCAKVLLRPAESNADPHRYPAKAVVKWNANVLGIGSFGSALHGGHAENESSA